MNRLQKKCFIVSAGLHGMLAAIALICPAFVSSKSKSENPPILDFVAIRTTDDKVSGGGVRDATPPPPAPVNNLQPPSASVAREAQPDSVKPEPTPRDTPRETRQAHQIEVNKTVVKSKPRDPSESRAAAERRAEAAAAAARKEAAASAIGNAISGIRGGISGSTSLVLQGIGGGGETYANFNQTVLTVYDKAWVPPDSIKSSEAVVTVRVTIKRDGTVSAARIIQRSGDPEVDRSIQQTLDRVTFVAPLPDSSTESERTVEFDFKAKAKASFG